MVEWVMKDELERIWEKAVWPNRGTFPSGLRKPRKNVWYVGRVCNGVPAEFESEPLPLSNPAA